MGSHQAVGSQPNLPSMVSSGPMPSIPQSPSSGPQPPTAPSTTQQIGVFAQPAPALFHAGGFLPFQMQMPSQPVAPFDPSSLAASGSLQAPPSSMPTMTPQLNQPTQQGFVSYPQQPPAQHQIGPGTAGQWPVHQGANDVHQQYEEMRRMLAAYDGRVHGFGSGNGL
jgi:hypothetical protein